MAVYSASNALGGTLQSMTTTYKSLLILTAATATLTRAIVQEFDFGTAGTPADNVMQWDVSRQTAAGTATTITPNPMDGTIRAAGTVGAANATAEGTVTANSSLFNLGINQRASFRWVATPGSEMVIPATNLAGLTFRALSPAYTSTATAAAVFIE